MPGCGFAFRPWAPRATACRKRRRSGRACARPRGARRTRARCRSGRRDAVHAHDLRVTMVHSGAGCPRSSRTLPAPRRHAWTAATERACRRRRSARRAWVDARLVEDRLEERRLVGDPGRSRLLAGQVARRADVRVGQRDQRRQRLLDQRADGDEVATLLTRQHHLRLVGDRHVLLSRREQLQRSAGFPGCWIFRLMPASPNWFCAAAW